MSKDSFNIDADPQQVLQDLNWHKHGPGEVGDAIQTDGLSNVAVTEPKLADNSVSNRTVQDKAVGKSKLDDEVQALLSAGSSGSLPGIADFIMKDMKLIPNSDLSLKVDVGRALIGEKVHNLAAQQSVALSARMAALIYAQKSATDDVPVIGKVEAVDPVTFVDNNTVGLWKFNQTGAGSHIPNSAVGLSTAAVANDLVPSGGLTSVDGWNDYAIQGDGSTGNFTATNTTGIPVYSAEYGLLIFISSYKKSSGYQFFYSDDVRSLYTPADGSLYVSNNAGSDTNTGYILEQGKSYLIALNSLNGSGDIYVFSNGGGKVYSGQNAYNITLVAPRVLSKHDGSYKSPSTVDFAIIKNKQFTSQQIAQIANKLCLPCQSVTQTVAYKGISQDVIPAFPGNNTLQMGNFSISAVQANYSSYYLDKIFDKSNVTGSNWQPSSGQTANITIKMPSSIIMDHYTLACDPGNVSNAPKNFTLSGSNDNQNFTVIDTQTNIAFSAGVTQSFNLPATTAYQYYRLDVTATGNGATIVIGELDFYSKYVFQDVASDIRSILPADAISLGRVRTSSSAVIEYNDSDYQYGRREKAVGGNRKVFLGRKYFSGNIMLSWNNPFGTRKVRVDFTWSSDANGTNETQTANDGGSYGVKAGSTTYSLQYDTTTNGAAFFNGAWQTSGYIGCYAEILEDD